MHKKYKISEYFAIGENTPLFTSAVGLEELSLLVEKNIKSIRTAKSPRHLVIETWLILEYFVRKFIISGLNIEKYSVNDFDISYELLPNSFKSCLEFLKKFVKTQKGLADKPSDFKIELQGSFEFIKFISKERPDLYDNHFVIIQKEYYKKHHPKLLKYAKTLQNRKKEKFSSINSTCIKLHKSRTPFREVNQGWIKMAQKLDEDWFKDVEKINDIRNSAAHMINTDFIYRVIGINGKDEKEKFKNLKIYCIEKLSKLLDMSIAKRKYKKYT